MYRWSLKTLLLEPARLGVSSLAVAFSFVLVVFFSAVFEGESEQMIMYLEKMDADLWVMQKGVSNMHMASSMIWDWKAERIRQMPQVADVAAILYLNGPVRVGGKDWFSYIIGIEPGETRAGPWSMASGKSIPEAGEAVIPETISSLTGVGIGDTITMIDRQLRVVGLSRGSFSMASSLVFVSREDLGDVLEGKDQDSYVMVYAREGIDTYDLARSIEDEVGKVNVLGSQKFIENDRQLAVQMGAEIVRMMTSIGILLAIVIVAFTAYSLVARRKRELAIAKALGFGNGQICAAVLLQSFAITAIGLVLSMLIGFTILSWLPAAIPQINLSVRLHQFVGIGQMMLPVAILASLAAAQAVFRADPMTVFQG